jgi:hypothetical protein
MWMAADEAEALHLAELSAAFQQQKRRYTWRGQSQFMGESLPVSGDNAALRNLTISLYT